jgi:transposase
MPSSTSRAWAPTRSMRSAARSGGRPAGQATPPPPRWLKGARWALWKAPERLTERQRTTLSTIQATNRRLYRAYLLKEQLRAVFHEERPEGAIELLDAWVAWAQRSRLPSFVRLAATARADRQAIAASLTHRLSNARMEAANTTIRLITRWAYGFRSVTALIALALLTLGGLCPPLPGRSLT